MNIHFTGVGGIGMSALARYFLSQGHAVSGSDSSESVLTNDLQNEGVQWIKADNNIPENTELFIFTEAVPVTNVQRQEAKNNNIRSLSYFQALGEISQKHTTICVCGTHGKSTTTAMLGIALQEAEADPLVIVGTKVKEFGGKNIRVTQNKQAPFIVESCEYRESFLSLSPFGVVLINCEHDHIDYYPTEKLYVEAFKKLIKKIPADGFLVANFDDKNVVEVAKSANCKVIPIQFSKIQDPIQPKVPGWHNQLNAELAFAAGKELLKSRLCEERSDEAIPYDTESNVIPDLIRNPVERGLTELNRIPAFAGMTEDLFLSPPDKGDLGGLKLEGFLKNSLSNFSGTWRRFDILGEKNGLTIIDDYGHHPTEIEVTLKALEDFAPNKKKVIVFQPHQYSRTRELFNEFVESFSILKNTQNKLFICDIYEARDSEEDKAAVSAQDLVKALKDSAVDAEYSGDYKNTFQLLQNQMSKTDIIMSIGAGPINTVTEQLV